MTDRDTGRELFQFTLRLPPLDGATAAWLVDFFGQLGQAIWHSYGDDIEAHWTATEPDHPIYGPPPRRSRPRRG